MTKKQGTRQESLEPSQDAITAAFYALYGRKGGAPTDERDGPELVAVRKSLTAAYAIDFARLVGHYLPDHPEKWAASRPLV